MPNLDVQFFLPFPLLPGYKNKLFIQIQKLPLEFFLKYLMQKSA